MRNIKLIPSLLAFAEVANQQSFTGAAKQLGMSKSAISQHIKKLEEHLGQQLLSRNTRGMSVTAVGYKLLDRSELLRDQVDLAFEELSKTKESPSGTFAITFPHPFSKHIVIPALNQLCKEYPKIEPHILASDDLKDLIKEKLDVAITGGELKDSNYRALPIGSAHEIFCATPSFLQKIGHASCPAQLQSFNWIPAPWQGDSVEVYKNNFPEEKLEFVPRRFGKINALPSTVDMVLLDMGYAILPEYIIEDEIKEGKIVRILPKYQGRVWPFYYVHRFQNEKPIHVKRFYQLMKHFFDKANRSN